jgi:hypothetical protein
VVVAAVAVVVVAAAHVVAVAALGMEHLRMVAVVATVEALLLVLVAG